MLLVLAQALLWGYFWNRCSSDALGKIYAVKWWTRTNAYIWDFLAAEQNFEAAKLAAGPFEMIPNVIKGEQYGYKISGAVPLEGLL